MKASEARPPASARTSAPRCTHVTLDRLFFVDGSGFAMLDTPPLQEHLGQPGGRAAGCGFPVARLLVLLDHPTGLIRQTLALPLRSHDVAHAAALHPELRPGDVSDCVRFTRLSHPAGLAIGSHAEWKHYPQS